MDDKFEVEKSLNHTKIHAPNQTFDGSGIEVNICLNKEGFHFCFLNI